MPVQTRYQADIEALTEEISDYEAQITQQLEALQSLFETEEFSDDEASDVNKKTKKKRERLNQEGRARYDELVASRGRRIDLDSVQETLNRDILELTTQINTIQFQTGFAALWEHICNLYNRLWGHATRLEATEASKEAAELSKPYFDKVISLTREKLPLDMRIQHTLTAQKDFMKRRDELCRDIHPYRSSSTAEKGKHLFDNMRTALGNIGASERKTRVLDANEQLNLVAAALEDFLKDSTDTKHQALLHTIRDNPLYVAAEKIASFQPLLDEANDAYAILPTISDRYKARIQQAQHDATEILGDEEEDDHGQYGRYGKGGPNND
ncbi:MAG: hypothetical protein P1U32_07260 [Legionellaceae bacterium]|nr:hypothetical protein [Legionellaceae bacterium]